ncbi:MAG: PKD domain-containing protein [Saprospiraceae bacterium]|nr:PKD domain-containing protein [Saprospiraceae bacterium]
MLRNCTLLFFSFLVFSSPLTAKHIIGGGWTYECLGNGTYEFTLTMYRDCSDPTGAGFDFNAPVSIYKGNDPNPLSTILVQFDFNVEDIEPDVDNPCVIIPPGVCVEKGVYQFQYTFADWPSLEPYTISYQRCCRNSTISNVVNPGDIGATFTIELTTPSMALCNNSPVFETLPPTVICVNEGLEYLHSAIDVEGDQLIYELCAALEGGGMGGVAGGNATACDGVTPNPACPPPYQSITYQPPYNPLNPLGGNPQITIDPNTGLLTGTPDLQGQFVVGVCVYEYRNGQLLSVIRREFQFNVAYCEPLVFADIEEDTTYANIQVVQFCPYEEVFIENSSILNSAQDEFYWEFTIEDSLYTFSDFEPTIDLPGPGIYPGQFVILQDLVCADSIDVWIEVYPETAADFQFEYDTCIAGPVFFSDQSVTDSDGIIDWSWDFDDTEISESAYPVHFFTDPGLYEVQLIVTDTNYCQAGVQIPVSYFPVPGLILVSPNDTSSCPPATIIFENLSEPIDETYKITWDFGDGGMDTLISPEYTYEEAGIYSVNLNILSPIGCETDTTFENLIRVSEMPVADFIYSPRNFSQLEPNVHLEEVSIDAVFWDWYIDSTRIGTKPEINYVFQDTGWHDITLIVNNAVGCLDTLTRRVDVVPEIRYFLPTAFSPNYDDVNDFFGPNGIFLGITNYQMEIWNRWGERVFQSTDIGEMWDGRKNGSDRISPSGVYSCIVRFTGPRGKPYEFQTYLTLLR